MSVEVNPVGRRCGANNGGLSCVYCYLPLEARTDSASPKVDHAAIQKAVLEVCKKDGGGERSFSLFGGEPLLARLEDLEKLWAFGLEKFGRNGVQTSGRPITEELWALFAKYNVNVGFSIDGPEELNDPRWAGSTEATREATARSISWLERAIKEKRRCGLIVTLHRKNASTERLPRLLDWFRHLDALGGVGIELHLMERDGPVKYLTLSDEENTQALLAISRLGLKSVQHSLFRDMIMLLRGTDAWKWSDGSSAGVKCVWNACDPLATRAVHGIQADGSRSLCQRVNKDGVAWQPIRWGAFARQLALYRTPQEHYGCQGCRFFVLCKGQCPGTAVNGDWRRRTADCRTWFALFEHFETAMLTLGETPVTRRAYLPQLEKVFLDAWAAGMNVHVKDAIKAVEESKPITSVVGRDSHADHTDHHLSEALKAQGGEVVND